MLPYGVEALALTSRPVEYGRLRALTLVSEAPERLFAPSRMVCIEGTVAFRGIPPTPGGNKLMPTRLALARNLRFLGFGLSVVLCASCGDFLGTGGSAEPKVISVTPAEGATGVSVLSTPKIRFSTELDEGTVAGAVSLREGSREVRTRILLENSKLLRLEPTDPLDFGSSYQIVVEPTLRGKSGKLLSEQWSWGFRTEGQSMPPPNGDSLRRILNALAHDSMLGRGSGTVDEYRAAHYIAERFQAYGLQPGPDGWLQSFQAPSRKTQAPVFSQNVLAVIPGQGVLAEEWIVVGAHYDHVGLREQADGEMAVANGADDNASGTALLLEMARVFRKLVADGGIPTPDRRSILFSAFGAEEEGLLGSCYLARVSPPVPISMTRAMMNFDMVGRLREGVLLVSGLESSEAWADMAVNANFPELVLFEPPPCKACTDFACFRDQGLPYIWFFTGTHLEYHTPADDGALINFPGLVEVGNVALRVLSRLVVMPEGPARPSG